MIYFIIIIALLIVLAGMCKAAADLMRNRFDVSIWWRKPSFYDPRISYKRRRIFNYPVDGWHLANSGMISCFCGAIALVPLVPAFAPLWLNIPGLFAATGTLFTLSFNLFYNRIFLRKKYRK